MFVCQRLSSRPCLPLQLEVLSTLSDEQALHLLPPLRLLPGPPAAYLEVPASGGSSFGQACFGAAPGGGGSAAARRQELDLYVRLMTEGPLERCLAASSSSSSSNSSADGGGSAGSMEGNGGCCADCSVAVPLVLHRLARACFPDAAATPAAEQLQTQQRALLCSVLQRCTGSSSGGGGSQDLQRLLGMLLRWDAAAMQPSDAVSRERLQALEATCSAAGLDTAAVLSALEA